MICGLCQQEFDRGVLGVRLPMCTGIGEFGVGLNLAAVSG